MYKDRTGIISLLALCSLLFVSAVSPSPSFAATTTLNTPIKLTTHTADDFQPAVSPDGKMVAFVSSRSGNNDIWLVPIKGGPARQMTFHTASDSAPAWSRDGKRFAFTSLREDSKGDIWVLDMEGNIESRITDSRGAESYPSWFPDGKRIAFSRGEEVWSIDLPTHKEERLFNGLYPSVSPDGKYIAFISLDDSPSPQSSPARGEEAEKESLPSSGGKGSIYLYKTADNKITRLTGEFSDAFPSWSPDGREIYFSRFPEDTNSDGIINLQDNPSIWKIEFSSESDNSKLKTQNSKLAVQLTSGVSYELFPSATDQSVIYASSKGKDIDIYRVQRDGEIPKLKTVGEQLGLAYRQREALHRLLAFRKVSVVGAYSNTPLQKLKEQEVSAEAQYQVALTYLEMGHKKDAIRELESINSKQTLIPHPSSLILNKYASLARIELAKVKAADALSAGDKGRALEEVKTLLGIIDEYRDHPYSQAMAQLEIGDIYLSLKDDVQALKEYEKVRGLYSSEIAAVAQARLRMADIFSSYGDEQRIIDTYLSIIKDYPDSLEWCLTASQRVLSLIERIKDERERLARYREIISKYKGLPYLPALAQYKVGEFYHVRGRYEEAVSEYRRVLDDFPSETSIADEASIAMAEVWLSRGSHGNALSIYEGLMKKEVLRAGRLFINTSLEKGRMELLGKEPAQAIKSYKAVIDLDYNYIRAHRGLIEAYAVKGEPQKAVAIYTGEVKKFADSDTAHYALGLAYTYLNPPALNSAESEIKTALSQNYSLPFAHQTLGWVYEIKDKTENSRTMGLAVDEYMAALALFPPEQKKEASDLLLNIGNGYSALGNHEKGYEFYKKRVETGVGFDDRMREAVFYENLGNAASRTGKYTEAVPYYQKCLGYAKKARDRKWELKITEEMALLYQEARDYAKAADYFSQALKIAEEADMAEARAVILRNIAYNLYHAEKIEEGIGYFNKSLDALNVKEDISSSSGGLLTIKKALSLGKEGSEAFMGFEKAGEEKLIHSYLGSAYAETGEYESALNELLKKLERIPEGRDTERGIVLNNIGFLYYQMGDAGNAYRYFNNSLEVSGKAKNFTGEMVNIINIGLLAAQDEFGVRSSEFGVEETIKLQERGIKLIGTEKRGIEYLSYLKNNLGLLYLTPPPSAPPLKLRGGRGELVTDLDSLVKSSLNSINHDRERLKKATEYFTEGLSEIGKKKDLWLEAVLELNLATSLYHLGNDNDASVHLNSSMEIADKGSFNDLKWRCLSLLAEIDKKDKQKHLEDAVSVIEAGTGQQGFPLQTETVYKELIYLLFSNGKIDDAFTYAERMAGNRVRHEAAMARFSLPKEEAPISARDVQWFLDEKTALVRYLFTDRGLLIWLIDADNIQGKVVNVSEKELGKGIEELLSSLDKKEINDHLSPLVIRPIATVLANKKRVYIMPDEILSSVPFAVLKIENQLMVDTFELSYLPSAYILNAAYEKRNLNKVNILISQGKDYPDSYVEGIGSSTPIFAALKSDRTKFLDVATNYGMIHITDSLSINKTAPFRSSLDFRNGKLFLSELMPLKMNPNLVVLTNIVAEKALTPPPSASPLKLSHTLTPLILSGAPSILVRSTRTDRASEEIFMKEFYGAFRKESASGALAKAQRALKAKGMSPGVWAGYALYGYTGMNQEEERKYASKKVADIMDSAIEAYSKGDWRVAIRRFEEGLLFLRTIGAKEDLGNIYHALAKACANSGEYGKGASYQDQFIKAGSGKLSKPELAEGYRSLGVLYSRAGEDKKAEGALIEALKIWKEEGNKKSLSEGYRTVALLQEKGGSYKESIESFNAALSIDRETGNSESAGQDLWEIGRIYYLRLSNLDEAMKWYKEALSVFKGLGSRDKSARVLLDIGLVYEQGGEYESAKAKYLEAIKIAEEINDRSIYSRGTLYLANVAWRTGDYQEVFKYQRIALEVAAELKDRKQEAMAHNLAGLTYMNFGMLEKALEALSKSLSISTDTGDKLDAAAAYNNIGIVQRELGNLDKSVESFSNALTIDTELKTKWGMAYDMRNLGISYERMGRLDDAMLNLRSSLTLSQEIGERSNEAMTLYSLGMLYIKTGKEEQASGTLKEAYRIGKELNLPEVTWRSLKARASLFARGGKPADAYSELKEAINLVEKMRGKIKVDEYKTGFLENKSDLYEEMVILLLGMGRSEEAFNYSERGRSRNFIDMLGNQKLNLKSAGGQRLLSRERALRGRIDSFEERARGNTVLLEELIRARKDYEALLIEIKEESPELASFVTVEPPTLLDIQKTIPNDTTLLEYMVTKDGIVIWTVGRKSIESTIVPVSREGLKEKVVRYREMMEQVTPLEKESVELYNLLIRPVERLISGTKYIGIIPHDVLHYLSFSSLFDGRQYLMEAHPIFYSPSASVMKMIIDRKMQEDSSLIPHPSSLFLVIGNPDLGDSAFDLPFAEREAGSIGREFDGSEILLRKEATETRVREDIGRFEGVHFASHGIYDSFTPLFSSLKLTRDSANDGDLTANEVFSLNLKASIIMMSACQTGLGKLTTGDEIIGLNRAFIYAGAPSIISTLWRVNDAASAMLVKRFYRYYKKSDLAESIRLAQIAVKEYYPHPAYWAAFGLTGDYR